MIEALDLSKIGLVELIAEHSNPLRHLFKPAFDQLQVAAQLYDRTRLVPVALEERSWAEEGARAT